MSHRKTIAGCCAIVIASVAIWLDSHGHELGSQIFILCAFALSAPIALGFMLKGLREGWFWVALACTLVLHVTFLVVIWSKLPFDSGDNAFLVGGLELLALLVVSGKIIDLFPSGGDAAAGFAAHYPSRKRRRQR